MKKGAPVFLVIMFTAFPSMAEADGWDKLGGLLFLSYAGDFPTQTDDCADMLLGFGLNVPLLFNGIKSDDEYFPTTTSLMLVPMVSVEYSFLSDLLRIRIGAHFGRFHGNFVSYGYYAGLSGAFIQDFANDVIAVGISPEIGIEWYVFIIGFRVQAQYDFYTDERYNRFVVTTSLTVILSPSIL